MDIRKFIQDKSYCTITRNLLIDRNVNGFIHDVSNTLVIAQDFSDFQNGGYIIIRVTDIDDIVSDETDRFIKTILKKENLMEQVKYDYLLPINDMVDVLEYFKSTQSIFIVECQQRDEKEENLFYIGIAINVDKKKLMMKCFDGLGIWDSNESIIDIEKITTIQFDNPYIYYFSKYV